MQNININLIDNNNGQLDNVPQNPRDLTNDGFELAKKSIIEFPEMLQVRTLVVVPKDNRYVTIGGNQRLRAMRDLGYTQAPCVIVDWNSDQIQRFIIADNLEYGVWNYDMPKNKTIQEITQAFNSVGFNSVPCWIKPYNVLSNGQKMRVDLANALLSENNLIVFDEFTSVVDRDVAKISSFAIQKSIRKSNKKFIAVSCHFDIEDWLLPDWIFNTNTMEFINLQEIKKKDQISNWKFIQHQIKISGKCLLNTII